MRTVKVGDTVSWRGAWGSFPSQDAVVESMEVTESARSKYGTPVDEATEDQIKANKVLFVLDNGHWAYAEQINLKN